ncbi:hypothetical protein FRC07_014318 [Ceratobasidium sp. 392]|nr:hypothetical protein FRC07_014318 [Ceratobasidium sp. 392]
MLKLAPFPSYSFTTQFAGMSSSPSPARRRAALTPEQAFYHASGSFLAPEQHVHEDWIYRTTDTIPEASYSGSSSSSNLSPDLAAVATPAAASNIAHESHPPLAPSGFADPIYTRPRSNSLNPSLSSNNSGVHYSSAHRRVPSSPSFRSLASPATHAYFDRPPSPAPSISSRWSEPPMGGSLSLSELLAGTAGMSLSGPSHVSEDNRARREEQREGRRLAMLERHAALIEQREKRRWSKTARAGCIEWVENNSKQHNQL